MILDVKTTTNNFFERTELLSTYYTNARKFDTLTETEEREFFEEYNILKDEFESEKSLSKRALIEKEMLDVRDRIVNANLKFVISIARIYAKNYDILDLIEEGNIGLIKAVEKFDVTTGNKFSTYAVQWIRETINLYRQRHGSMIRKSNISKVFHILPKLTNEFVQLYQREPTSKELRDFINEKYPKLKIKESTDLNNVRMTSIDEPVDDDDDANMGNITLYNEYSSSSNAFEKKSDEDHTKHLVGSLLNKLDKRSQTIIKMHFGIDQEFGRQCSAKEIAEEVGLTVERTRQIIVSAKDELKRRYLEIIGA